MVYCGGNNVVCPRGVRAPLRLDTTLEVVPWMILYPQTRPRSNVKALVVALFPLLLNTFTLKKLVSMVFVAPVKFAVKLKCHLTRKEPTVSCTTKRTRKEKINVAKNTLGRIKKRLANAVICHTIWRNTGRKAEDMRESIESNENSTANATTEKSLSRLAPKSEPIILPMQMKSKGIIKPTIKQIEKRLYVASAFALKVR